MQGIDITFLIVSSGVLSHLLDLLVFKWIY